MKFKDMDELVFLWKTYGREKTSKLTAGAIELKRKVRAFVETLPTFKED